MVVPTGQPKILARRRWSVPGLLVLVLLGSTGCNEPSGTEVLGQARERLTTAPRVVVERPHGRVETYSRGLNVIEENGHVLNWATRRVEHYWLEDRSCYNTSTEFERADFRDQRRGTVPEASSARVEKRSGRTVIHWRLVDQERAPDREGSVLLDEEGRPVLVRGRSLPWGGEPARADPPTRISYPARVRIPRPSPLCRDAP
jgi:hypothetical protein